VLVLVGAVFAARAILSSAPEAQRSAPAVLLPTAQATVLQPVSYPIVLHSRGTVRPSRRTTLAPEVVGRVTGLSERFVTGGAFEAGEVLVRLDERDYRIALTRAQANQAQAEAALAEQRAQAATARADWRALGRRGEPSALTLREPQTAAALASRDAAEAEVQRARLDLERTRIRAPYDGRVLSRDVDEGQFVTRGAPIGVIYAIESVEVGLPLGARQVPFLELPSVTSPSGAAESDASRSAVVVESGSGPDRQAWSGRILRVEGVDAGTQQLNLVARIERPFDDPERPLRIGQYVRARIDGRTLEQVFVLPRASLRDEREVLLLDDEGRVSRRAVTPLWSDDEVVVVRNGLTAGEILVLTPLATIADGAPVRATIDGREPDEASRPSDVDS